MTSLINSVFNWLRLSGYFTGTDSTTQLLISLVFFAFFLWCLRLVFDFISSVMLFVVKGGRY